MRRKPTSLKGKKTLPKQGNRFLIRKLSMTDRFKLKSIRSRNTLIKGQDRKMPI